jgi:hypothetical protein
LIQKEHLAAAYIWRIETSLKGGCRGKSCRFFIKSDVQDVLPDCIDEMRDEQTSKNSHKERGDCAVLDGKSLITNDDDTDHNCGHRGCDGEEGQ